MHDGVMIGWGYKFLKILLIILIVTGLIFLVWFFFKNRPPDIEGHRSQLELLEEAYQIRRAYLRRQAEEMVQTAPNEVLAIKYQQELSLNLDKTEDIYFRDRRSILAGEDVNLEQNWGPEMIRIRNTTEADEQPTPAQ